MAILVSRAIWPRPFGGVCLALALLLAVTSAAFGQEVDEYEVKAAFLINFAKFIEWPAAADSPEFPICVLGDDPFGSSLERLIKGKTVDGRTIVIRKLKEADQARQCRIVFVTSQEKDKSEELVAAVEGTSVLTVSEKSEFAEIGGMVYLPTDDHRVTVVINTNATERAGLKISAKLLSLAKIFSLYERGGRQP